MRLPFFGRRRSDSRVFAHRTSFLRSAGHGTFVPPPPQPRELIGVVGVGTTESVRGVGLTLLSVERYAEGIVVLFRLLRRRGVRERDFSSPSLAIAVSPAGSTPYRVLMKGGGGGGSEELEFRLSYAIVPAPPPDASAIAIEVTEIAWERHRDGRPEIVSRDTGPWRFTVAL